MNPDKLHQLTTEYLKTAASTWACLRDGEVEFPLNEVYAMLQAIPAPPPKPLEPPRSDLLDSPERIEHAGFEQIPSKIQPSQNAPPPPPPPPVALGVALAEARHLVLLGEPGAGKSTTLQFLGLCFSTPGMAFERLQLSEACIPVRLDLRSFADRLPGLTAGGGLALENALAIEVNRLLRQADAGIAIELVHAWRDQGQLLSLLDGLDEVPDDSRAEVQREIYSFVSSEAGRKCRVIVASRLAGYQALGSRLKEYTLKPFAGEGEILPYLAAWLAQLKPEWARTAGEQAAALLKLIQLHPALKRLSDNPLLLQMMAKAFAATHVLPSGRVGLYAVYVEDAWQRALRRGAQEAQKEAILDELETLAWQLHNGLPLTLEASRLDFLRETTGLVARIGELLSFNHLTVREYFVALRLKRAWKNNPAWTKAYLKPRLYHPAWREPLLLFSGMLEEQDWNTLLRLVLKSARGHSRLLHLDLLLASAMLGDTSSVSEVIIIIILNRIKQLFVKKGQRNNQSFFERKSAVRLLETATTTHCWPSIVKCLINLDYDLHKFTFEILGEMGRTEILPVLSKLLQDDDEYVRRSADELLDRININDASCAALKRTNDVNLDIWVSAEPESIRLQFPKTIPPKPQALDNEDENAYRVSTGELEKNSNLDSLRKALKDEDINICISAGYELSRIGTPETVDVLLQALMDKDKDVRAIAAHALGHIGALETVPPLQQALMDDDPFVRQTAALALGNFRARETVPALLQALQDDNEGVRSSAAVALGFVKDLDSVPALLHALQDEDEGVRSSAAQALGEIRAQETVPALLNRLRDNSKHVRKAAAVALGMMNQPNAIPTLWKTLKSNLYYLDVQLVLADLQSSPPPYPLPTSYLDPLLPPPIHPASRGLTFLAIFLSISLLAGLVAILALFSDLFSDIFKTNFKQTLETLLAQHPVRFALLAVALIGAISALAAWLMDTLKKRLPKARKPEKPA